MYARRSFFAPHPVGIGHLRPLTPPPPWRPVIRRSLAGVSPLTWRSRVSKPVVRAVRVPEGIRARGIVETDKLPSGVRDRTIMAVDSLGRRVTIGDVSSKAGLKLEEAERALQALAADAGGFLEVADDGDVLYVFPKDYRSKLSGKSLRMKLEPFLRQLKGAAEYLIRVSFGTALIASIAIVFTAIVALMFSSSESDDGRKRRDRGISLGGSSFRSPNIIVLPSDLFWYWDPYYYSRLRSKSSEEMNFLESVFSFVFGDGDPNQGIEEERWKLIGQYISSNGGVVTAEELAPFLDVMSIEKTMDDESYVLPALLQFDGHPEVDDEGNILYLFPSLQRTSSSPTLGRKEYVGRRRPNFANVTEIFEEKKWLFSQADASARAMVIGLGALNLFGVVTLGAMLRNAVVAHQSFIGFVADIFPFLQIYAAAFFAIPLIRWFMILNRNSQIEKRNKARHEHSRRLASPTPSLRRKLLSARDLSQKTVIGPDKIIYRSNTDLVDQDIEAQDWERRFRELER